MSDNSGSAPPKLDPSSLYSEQEKRDQLISELEEELIKLNDFDNWKEWKNFQILK